MIKHRLASVLLEAIVYLLVSVCPFAAWPASSANPLPSYDPTRSWKGPEFVESSLAWVRDHSPETVVKFKVPVLEYTRIEN